MNEQKGVLILGASGGIGASCAELFLGAGWKVAAQYHTSPIAEKENLFRLQCDLTDPAAVRRLVSLAKYRMGRIDCIVYTAGVACPKPFADTDDADFAALYDLHVIGAVRVIRAAMDELIETGGNVILFSSMWGEVGAAGESAYAAAKGAVIALTKSLAKEFGVYGIRVNCVSPGLIDTPMNACYSAEDLAPVLSATPLSRAGKPCEAAECALFLADASYVTGQILSPNGGFVV